MDVLSISSLKPSVDYALRLVYDPEMVGVRLNELVV